VKKKEKKNKKNLYVIVSIILICICCIFVIFALNKESDKSDNAFNVSFENENTVLISNTLPMTDIAGKQLTGEGTNEEIQGFVEFSIKSTSDKKQNYVVYLNDRKVDASIDPKHVRLYLTDFNDNAYEGFDSNIIPCYEDFKVSKKSPSDKILYSGVLNANEKKNFRLRVWVSDTYTLTESKENFSFDVKVKGE